ncbi:MAG: thiamine phosphate synthase [Bacillota bacterium]
MSDLICVTNRNLCRDSFIQRIEDIAKNRPYAILLREKDLREDEYKLLACEVMSICRKYDVLCILHSFVKAAIDLKAAAVHLPLPILRQMKEADKKSFSQIGASCHSLDEVLEAERLGCTYVTFGHVFRTDCKKGLLPRGLWLLSEVCGNTCIPVYAIGGISSSNFPLVCSAGARGGCIMSGFMQCENVAEYMEKF